MNEGFFSQITSSMFYTRANTSTQRYGEPNYISKIVFTSEASIQYLLRHASSTQKKENTFSQPGGILTTRSKGVSRRLRSTNRVQAD